MDDSNLIKTWQSLLADAYITWVLFRYGTCVIPEPPGDSPAERAVTTLREYGPVQVGTDSADFNVVAAPGGRLVTCYRPDILVFVSHRDVPPEKDDLVAGLLGRLLRDQDAQAPRPEHVEIIRTAKPACACLDGPGKQLRILRELGMDSHYAEATVLGCRVCGRRWLRYFYENEAISRSGRWYLGHIPTARALGLVAGEARRVLERLEWYHAGGSYFDGQAGRGSGEIRL